ADHGPVDPAQGPRAAAAAARGSAAAQRRDPRLRAGAVGDPQERPGRRAAGLAATVHPSTEHLPRHGESGRGLRLCAGALRAEAGAVSPRRQQAQGRPAARATHRPRDGRALPAGAAAAGPDGLAAGTGTRGRHRRAALLVLAPVARRSLPARPPATPRVPDPRTPRQPQLLRAGGQCEWLSYSTGRWDRPVEKASPFSTLPLAPPWRPSLT